MSTEKPFRNKDIHAFAEKIEIAGPSDDMERVIAAFRDQGLEKALSVILHANKRAKKGRKGKNPSWTGEIDGEVYLNPRKALEAAKRTAAFSIWAHSSMHQASKDAPSYRELEEGEPLQGIETSLRDGAVVRAFRSGGGLRVVRIENLGDLVGYGEHPSIDAAIRHADEDFIAGGRPYGEVYGGDKPNYLTGSIDSTSELDTRIRQGDKFRSWQDGEVIYFELEGYAKVEVPKEILTRVMDTGISETWADKARGYTYLVKSSRFPNGGPCSSISVSEGPEDRSGSDPWMYHTSQIGEGANFMSAMNAALVAERIEKREAA